MESEYGSSPGIERLDVGIAALDRALGGGLPKGRSALVTGATGTGKNVLLSEFVYRGIAEHCPHDGAHQGRAGRALGDGWQTAIFAIQVVRLRQAGYWPPIHSMRPY